MKVKTVLTVGGSDPSGAGGIQADLKVFSAYRLYGMSVISALTAQNSQSVSEIVPVPDKMLASQFRAIYEDIRIDALKIGMLASTKNVVSLSQLLEEFSIKNIILDPVLVSSSGTPLYDDGLLKAMMELLFPLVDMVTPNLSEATVITGMDVENPGDMKAAAKKIVDLGAKSALVKGGHLKDRAIDIFYDGIAIETLDAPRLAQKDFRGTGCALSAAVAAGLARGFDMKESVGRAKDFVARSIKTGYDGLGKGMGVLNHNHPVL